MRILAALARGDRSALPPNNYLDIPARRITIDNVNEFWSKLKMLTGAAD